MQTINLTPILEALIGLLAAIITYWVVPMIKARTTEAQRATLEAAVRSAVYMAEQLYGAGKGKSKMEYALMWLREQGYDVDSRAVEAAVYECINQWREEIDSDAPPDPMEDDLK